MPALSVIICTYNPVASVFLKCLEAIDRACAITPPHEIIIIDNNSSPAIGEERYINDFITGRTIARVVRETNQGLTPARLRGIREATGDLLVFIDDDNIITADFFKTGYAIAANNHHIGAWSGQVKLIFEKKPEEWTHKYWGLLVWKEFDTDRWSNLPLLSETMPCGAGLFVRKNAADHYYRLHEEGKRKVQLDRSGDSLFSAGDNDIAACACDLKMGVGLFHELQLEHYIPQDRITRSYLLKLAEGIAASAVVLRSFRNVFPPRRTFRNRMADTLRLLFKNNTDRQFYKAVLKGERIGADICNKTKQ
jgi:glycosyltransferase involved in cell wall biosynthesis